MILHTRSGTIALATDTHTRASALPREVHRLGSAKHDRAYRLDLDTSPGLKTPVPTANAHLTQRNESRDIDTANDLRYQVVRILNIGDQGIKGYD